jgi:hypothetical protein
MLKVQLTAALVVGQVLLAPLNLLKATFGQNTIHVEREAVHALPVCF